MRETSHHRVAVVGTGFGGLGTAAKLLEAGFDDIVLLERAGAVGGVWRDNTYPGAACDVQSHLYSFSFAPNPDWTRQFSPQSDILAYLERCTTDFGLRDKIRFHHEVTGLAWDDEAQRWEIETSQGALSADHVVMAAGVLSDPAIPDLPGIDRFQGRAFHSAQWPADLDLAGKAVAVVGTGASAIQFVPAIQPTVASLTLFQRTPPWVMPRHDFVIGPRRRALFRKLPVAQQLERAKIAIQRELFILGFRHPVLMKAAERTARAHLASQVADPVLREKLTPDYRLGCKRILISNEYLRSLDQPNADVACGPIKDIRAHSVVDDDGVEHDADVIIYGTGFRVSDTPWARDVRGRDGVSLHDAWAGSPKAYLGTTVAGFPNLSLIHGPNIGLGHTSVIEMFESQIAHIVSGIEYAGRHRVGALEPTPAAQSEFVAEIEKQMQGTVWTAGGCTSWYLDQTGRNSALWPASVLEYRLKARDFKPEKYTLTARGTRDKVPA